MALVRRGGDKYHAILQAATRVIAEAGYHGAQVTRIARAAGVADGTIYLYFKNKEDLLISIFRERVGRMVAEACTALTAVADPAEQLRLLVEGHLQLLASDRDLAVVTQLELRQPSPTLREPIQAILRGYLDLIDGVVRAGQEQGRFSAAFDHRQVRNLIFGTLDQTVSAWVMTGFGFDLAAQAEPTYRLLMQGIST